MQDAPINTRNDKNIDAFLSTLPGSYPLNLAGRAAIFQNINAYETVQTLPFLPKARLTAPKKQAAQSKI